MSAIERLLVCPYCGGELTETWQPCCGECGHAEYIWIDENGEETDAPETDGAA